MLDILSVSVGVSIVSLLVSIIAYIIARREKDRYDKAHIKTDIPARRN